MALELLKITGSQPYYLNNASTAEELVRALEDYMRTGTQIIFQHDGDDCILTSYEYNTDENKVIAYFVTPKKKLLKVDIGAGWDLVITESEFTPETDKTLTQSGKPADAKKTGERFMVFEENVLGYMDEIRDLISSMGLKPQEKTIDITENGTVEVTPDEGYALSKVTANVNVVGSNPLQLLLTARGNSVKGLFSSLPSTVKNIDDIIDSVDFSNVTNMEEMFRESRGLTKVPHFNTSNVTTMRWMFSGAEKMESIPAFDTSKVTTMKSCFYSNYELTDVPYLDTSKVTDMEMMFTNCKKLSVVPAFDTRSVTMFGEMFDYCTALTECWIRNIKTTIAIGSGTSYGHLLTLESLLHLCKECRNVNASRRLTVGTANLAKLEGIYVKLIDITDEMRAEDDFIDEKYPFVQCESTDTDAMTIQDYMALKKWTLA